MTVSVTAKSRTITNGTANDGSVVEAIQTELYNNDSTVATGVNGILGTDSVKSKVDGKFIVVRNSFASAPASGEHCGLEVERGSSANVVARYNETNDWWEVTHDGTNYFPVSLVVSADPGAPANGYFWYNSTSHLFKGYQNGATVTFPTSGSLAPKKYVGGPAPQWISNSTIRIPAGALYRDDTDAVDLLVGSDLDVVLSGSGALGLDTGSENANTWYYLWLCKGASGLTAVFSTSKTSPTLPTGYTTYKRRVRGAFRNDNSSNLIPVHYITHGLRAEVQYMLAFTNFVNAGPTRSSAGRTNILSAGSATSDTTIAATANYVPPVSRLVKLHYSLSQSFARLYEPGTSDYVGISNAGQSDPNYNDGVTGWLRTDSSQQIGYALPVTSGNLSLDVDSFLDTEED